MQNIRSKIFNGSLTLCDCVVAQIVKALYLNSDIHILDLHYQKIYVMCGSLMIMHSKADAPLEIISFYSETNLKYTNQLSELCLLHFFNVINSIAF